MQPYADTLLQLVAENPQVTKVEMEVELGISRYRLNQVIKRAGITHKRCHRQPITRNTANLIQERQIFAQAIVNIPEDRRIFLDETGFNLHTQFEYGWAPGNLVPIVPLNPNRGRNCMLVLAISQFGVEGYEVFAGACNAERLTNFILNKLNPNIRDRNPYLFMSSWITLVSITLLVLGKL